VFPRVGVQALQCVGVDALHDLGREEPLEEPAGPAAPSQVVEIRTRDALPSGVTALLLCLCLQA
jgi:hypothetical protein